MKVFLLKKRKGRLNKIALIDFYDTNDRNRRVDFNVNFCQERIITFKEEEEEKRIE